MNNGGSLTVLWARGSVSLGFKTLDGLIFLFKYIFQGLDEVEKRLIKCILF